MKFTRKIALAAAAGLAALGAAAAVPATASAATSAHQAVSYPPGITAAKAVPNSLGPGWTAGYWSAESGGGCAQPSVPDYNLTPIVSDPCGYYTWYWRVLGTYPRHGQEIELVNSSGTEAVGFSGGLFKLVPPSDTSSFVVFDTSTGSGCSGSWCTVQNNTVTDFAIPNGKGLDLKISGTGSAPPDGWQH